MSKGIVRIYYGEGSGKSSAALGMAVREASHGKTATVISFLKEKEEDKECYLKRLEPELKFFRFEKTAESYDELTDEEKEKELMNIRMGYNYSKKVITTGGCDVVILDEILCLLEHQIITEEELLVLLEAVSDDMAVVCTGKKLPDSIREAADEIYEITRGK